MRFWRNTTVASLAAGADRDAAGRDARLRVGRGSGQRFPARRAHPAVHTTVGTAAVLHDYGSTYGSGTATHALTLYRHPSGALVFGAGTVQWSWGLDSNHDRGTPAADVRMQQATVNLFADMGVQPTTLQSGLVTADAVIRLPRHPPQRSRHPQRRDVPVARSRSRARLRMRRRRRRWRRSFRRRRRHLASRHGRDTWTFTWTPRAQRHGHDQASQWTTAATWRGLPQASRSR